MLWKKSIACASCVYVYILFLLSQLTHLDVNVGLYRDDGLATGTKSPKQVEAIKKEMCKIFKHNTFKSPLKPIKKL